MHCAKDHPRRCGENLPKSSRKVLYRGSPPQVRGKLYVGVICVRDWGITPAGAGKTAVCPHVQTMREDHPRRCGENLPFRGFLPRQMGSPPQVRGKQFLYPVILMKAGITPAGAGKTLKRSFRNQPFCSRAVQISFNFSNSLNVSLQSGSAR